MEMTLATADILEDIDLPTVESRQFIEKSLVSLLLARLFLFTQIEV
jgi:hypothetical protein